MKRKTSREVTASHQSLIIRAEKNGPLRRTQAEFNRLMKSLEKAKDHHATARDRLDDVLKVSIHELMPVVEEIKRMNRDFVLNGYKAMKTIKLTATRQQSWGDLLLSKAKNLRNDPVGLSKREIDSLGDIIKQLDSGTAGKDLKERVDEFNQIRRTMEKAAREAGLDLDLSDLDPRDDLRELDRLAGKRLRAAIEHKRQSAPGAPEPKRKPSKAKTEKERNRLEQEKAKNRDLKSLFKQLAKAFHPDLEPEPELKEHKKVWMQRLNTAYAANDLREMLQLEMEWLGEEATNLNTAGDEKLKIYCAVLKEQITDIKHRTHDLPNEPQYGPLQRFRHPRYGTVANPYSIKRELGENLKSYQELMDVLLRNDANSRRMIYQLADEHARQMSHPS